MGWNCWNCWAHTVNDKRIRQAADAMIRSGLAAHGYQYVNIDDTWPGRRDRDGEIHGNERFPDMKALGDYVHAKGLKFGIYSSPGPQPAHGYEGSFKHEELDAKTWAAWGVDYLKYDWCSYSVPNINRQSANAPLPEDARRPGPLRPQRRLRHLRIWDGAGLAMGRRRGRKPLANHQR